MGDALKIALASVAAGDKLLVPGDIHFDLHDQDALDVMLITAKSEGVNSVCLIGDTFESAGISRHKQMRSVRNFVTGAATIKKETDAATPTMLALSKLASPGKRHVLAGNHDGSWWAGVQDEYPGLLGIEWYEMYGDLFDGWHMHQEYTALKYGTLLVCHGHRLRGSLSKNSAASVLANYPGQNTLYGHTHRIDEATTPTFKYGKASANGAWTIGHLKRRDVELMDSMMGPHSEKHQQGFGLVSFFDYGAPHLGFNVEKVRIHRDVRDRPFAVINGKVYRG